MYEDLLKELRYLATVYRICENTSTKEYKLAVDAADAIEKLQKPKWVSVKEDLPNPYDLVLVVNTFGGVHYGYYDTNLKWYTANNWLEDAWTWMPNVAHWMPLPEPPKEGE